MDLSHLRTIRIAACDLNGQMRGKRMPVGLADKLADGAARMPISTLNVDLWGRDVEDNPLVFETGDADGVMLPTERGAVPMPWLANPSALVPMAMYWEDGRPFMGDPRHVLADVLARYQQRGWRVVAATEMEFSLLDDSGAQPAPPIDPLTGRELDQQSVLSVAELDAFDAFFTDLYEGSDAMGIPAQSAISEAGLGQFEINLNHQEAMRAADDAWLFKALVKGLARKHGFAATFMAKPYAEEAGNGMHVHFSVEDEDGNNIFNDGSERGSDLLMNAVAGCLTAMPASTLILAPHGNSYDRLVPGAHAPVSAAWAYENRTAAIRIPGGSPKARRIEHRVAGGDINPYLMLAVVLGAALAGIEDGATPPAPSEGNIYEIDGLPQLAPDWASAVDLFDSDPLIARILPDRVIRNLVMMKRQELAGFAERPAESHWLSWLEAV
ncbi:gamma-glutamylputrescine synthetase PuuA [Phaeobacter inhibens]|uniref:glutamine synthetase family protein n=1 Tax=Phaeobacter inhibens TaxID=221822 RepID=UPI000C9B105E|nr:glutamine synthetase family protein [Phaeobacter inhibens]AUQ58089.1 gamma-glutamylputrescine synthetase PuuA [Phaeobacter inhibens]AUQ62111.1 gamma-glutamylputrescine synthetase PuuA [Phaeobacter inhibens]AUQ82085.1 gamma-glutamylputrescine synthetase PuuA [Phaeobacter inhibens]AUQ89808.1 gamma-glutamylputrescine synthetase PuuA [Phaeobacter inhibens]AUR11150.1 gamma-glutamylputrescine synthetase PuuA [Phaeobacter inhibens]